jgi:hypothetical protein
MKHNKKANFQSQFLNLKNKKVNEALKSCDNRQETLWARLYLRLRFSAFADKA